MVELYVYILAVSIIWLSKGGGGGVGINGWTGRTFVS